jgi:membrane protease YdiL (CAAX protease family)
LKFSRSTGITELPQKADGEGNRLYRFSIGYPILLPVVLFLITVSLRVVDIFFLPLAQALGEAILHKALGFALVLGYVWAAGRSVRAIGLHGSSIWKAMFIAATGLSAVFVPAFGLQLIFSRTAGTQPRLLLAAIDPQTGLTGGLSFAFFLIAGNLVNSFAEEGLFRGVMLTHFRLRLEEWGANILQAVLFGLWHLTWPVFRLLTGQITLAGSISQAGAIVLASTLSGLAYGYLYLRTDSLWAPWIAHTINNSVLNLLHIRTIVGLDAEIGVLYGVIGTGYLALLLWTALWARRFRLPRFTPWAATAAGGN